MKFDLSYSAGYLQKAHKESQRLQQFDFFEKKWKFFEITFDSSL